MKKLTIALVFSASLLGATDAGAQPSDSNARKRPILEQQLRERMAEVTRKRLQLSDVQMVKLQAVNSGYAPQLGKLAGDERATRQQLRVQLSGANPDEAEVGRLLDTMLRIQRQRLTLLESEQKDLSGFLTAVQRAKYIGLQQQLRRRAEQLRGPGPGRPGGRAGNRPLR